LAATEPNWSRLGGGERWGFGGRGRDEGVGDVLRVGARQAEANSLRRSAGATGGWLRRGSCGGSQYSSQRMADAGPRGDRQKGGGPCGPPG
jgi:hypothetical protein